MCGIAGILSFKSKVDKASIKIMTDKIIHRGPDGEGQWVNFEGKIGLGHRRLSIIDTSNDGKQPMHYLEERYTITFNGEIYNYIELKEYLKKKNYQFQSNTDTEVLLALYDLKKESCLDYLDGMFAFAIWDEKKQELFGARDRMGEKPFYYYKNENQFIFASEMKAIFPKLDSVEVDKSMVLNYMINDLVVNPQDEKQTFYKGIKKLPKSHWFKLNIKGEFIMKKYWDLSNATKINVTLDVASSEFYTKLVESVKRRLRSDVPVGSSLSGGLDSSIIVSIISRQIKKNANHHKNKTFSAKFKEKQYDESKFIDLVVNSTEAKSYSIYPNSCLISDEIEKIFYHQEEPFQSASILNQWDVMRLADQNNVTVLLDGQGADEILGGYNWYQNIYYQELFKKSKSDLDKELKQVKENKFSAPNINWKFKMRSRHFGVFKQLTKLKYYAFKIGRIKLLNKNGFLLNYLSDDLLAEMSSLAYIKPYPPSLNKTLKMDHQDYVLETLLRFSDRNAMAFSKEVRLPYTNHELVELLFSLPSNMKIRGGWTKYIMRKSFEKEIPKEITWRRDKMGYAAPQSTWLDEVKNKQMVLDYYEDLINMKVLKKGLKMTSEVAWKVLMIRLLYKTTQTKLN